MELEPALDADSWREEYFDLFQSNGVIDAYDYVERYGNEPLDNNAEMKGLLSQMGTDLHGFERIYPADDQDLALVFINPGLNWRGGRRNLDDNYQLSVADSADLTRKCAISMDGGFHYLTSNNANHEAFKRLREILRKIGSETALMSDLTATLSRQMEFFADVYYTNWFKYATYGVGNIEEEVKHPESFVSNQLRRELSAVDPELVITLGKQPWAYGLRPFSTPLTEASKHATVSEAQNHLFECDLPDASFHVLPYNHPSDRDRSRAVGLDADMLEDALTRFKQETGQ